MVRRKLQFQNGSFFIAIPRALIDSMGLASGNSLSIVLNNGKIVISTGVDK